MRRVRTLVTLNAVARGQIIVGCGLCTWFYGLTTHNSNADLAPVLDQVRWHLNQDHGIDDIPRGTR